MTGTRTASKRRQDRPKPRLAKARYTINPKKVRSFKRQNYELSKRNHDLQLQKSLKEEFESKIPLAFKYQSALVVYGD